jgi:hypothetical protein
MSCPSDVITQECQKKMPPQQCSYQIYPKRQINLIQTPFPLDPAAFNSFSISLLLAKYPSNLNCPIYSAPSFNAVKAEISYSSPTSFCAEMSKEMSLYSIFSFIEVIMIRIILILVISGDDFNAAVHCIEYP